MLQIILFLFLLSLSATSESLLASIKKSHLGSDWYPLKSQQLDQALNKADHTAAQLYNATLTASDIKAIIVPHAAYQYSGAVAASAYRLVDSNSINKVIILAPAHRISFSGVALPDFQTYQTPLGSLAVNTPIIQELSGYELFHTEQNVFNTEHSLEIQLPFLQHYLKKDITIIPLIVGQLTGNQASRIAQILKKFITPDTLVVISSDFVHYGKSFNFKPFKEHPFYNIRALNSSAIEYIQAGQSSAFAQFMERSNATICGYFPLTILLSLLEHNAWSTVEPRLIAYDTSDKQSLSVQNSVSYIALLFTRQKIDSMPIEKQLTQQEQRSLVQEAYAVLNAIFDPRIPPELLYPLKSWGLLKTCGAFVTLEKKTKKGKELRGCIGHIMTDKPLYETIATVTRDAALNDRRFAPVKRAELPDLSLKISVLSSIIPIKSPENIIVGKHGVILQYENRVAVFLPEVPLEFKWDKKTMLEELSRKAGLPKDMWRDAKTQFHVFTTVSLE